MRESTCMLLEGYGYTVRGHASARSFLASDPGEVGLLVVDQHMPGMTGLELLELLHAEGPSVRAVVVTGRTDATIEARLAALGVKVLYKPVAEDQLMAVIEEVPGPADG